MADSTSAPPSEPTEMAARFRALHERQDLFVLPNPFDVGSARLLEHLGFEALATTSAGFARSLGRPDGARAVSRDEAVGHAREIVEAVSLPVTGDLEDGFSVEPEGVVRTIVDSRRAGLAGCCIEDATYDRSDPIMDLGLATDRIAAAAEAAGAGGHPFVLTARAENLLYGWRDLDETITRLQSFAAAGADAVYAPGLIALDDIRAVVGAVDRPVNVLIGLRGQDWTLDDLREIGVRRVSVGSALSNAAFASVVEISRSLLDDRRLAPVRGSTPNLDELFAPSS